MNPVRNTQSHSSKFHFNIILSSTSKSYYWSRSFCSYHQKPLYIPLLHHAFYMPFLSHSLRFFQSHILSFLFSPGFLFNALFLNTLSLCSSFNVTDQVSHPYKIQTKLYELGIIYIFLSFTLEHRASVKRSVSLQFLDLADSR
jgi:hypothetical protein